MKSTEQRIKEYVGEDNVSELQVYLYGELLDVDLVYKNGKTLHDVREWLNNNIPNIWHMNVDRMITTEKYIEYGIKDESDEELMRIEKLLLDVELK